MSSASFDRLFLGGVLRRPQAPEPTLLACALIGSIVVGRDDEVRGKVGKSRNPPSLTTRPGRSLDQRLGPARRFGFREARQSPADNGFDRRQRVVVKIHFFGHGGGGGGALSAHGRYIARDEVQKDVAAPRQALHPQTSAVREHAGYLEERGAFYDWRSDNVDGGARMAVWANEDRRHFRLIISPENGTALHDLKPYTRELMERAESALGGRLEWVAIDHWDTDNPHTHVVLRGKRANGRPLILPRDFIKHGMRNMARDLATERLGHRSRDDERLSLSREALAHRPTRLDNIIAAALEGRTELRLNELGRTAAPSMQAALKLRARELTRLGLAQEVRRNVLVFGRWWREDLRAMEQHLDIRKSLLQSRGPDTGSNVDKGPGPLR